VRRLRSTLSAVKPMLSPEHYGWANGALKSLMAAMGAPRDWDVFAQQLLRPVTDALPDEEELARLGRLVERQRRAAYEEARRAISAPESTATILRLARWFEARAWRDQPVTETSAQLVQPIGDLAPTLLARRFRQARKRSRHFDTLPAPARHKLRIALKKLRYTIELLACLFDEDAVHGYIAPLKALQDDLGHLNDVRTAHAILTRLETDAAGDSALGRAGGLILGWHERGLAEQEGRLRKHVRRFRKREPFW
jgi:CHAD domain-containing protein